MYRPFIPIFQPQGRYMPICSQYFFNFCNLKGRYILIQTIVPPLNAPLNLISYNCTALLAVAFLFFIIFKTVPPCYWKYCTALYYLFSVTKLQKHDFVPPSYVLHRVPPFWSKYCTAHYKQFQLKKSKHYFVPPS